MKASANTHFADLARRAVLVALAAFALTSSVARAANEDDGMQLRPVDGVEFAVDHEMTDARLAELAAHVHDTEDRLHAELGVPRLTAPLRVYLFETRGGFSKYVRKHIPSVGWLDTARHGMFLLRKGKPYLFVVANDSVVASLRHETVHAVLNTSHPGLPIWLDEGLAQCQEDPSGDHWNERGAKVLKNDIFRRSPPNVTDLEKLRTMPQLGRREYAGCWLAAYQLQHDENGRQALIEYLAALRDKKTPASLASAVPVIRGIPERP